MIFLVTYTRLNFAISLIICKTLFSLEEGVFATAAETEVESVIGVVSSLVGVITDEVGVELTSLLSGMEFVDEVTGAPTFIEDMNEMISINRRSFTFSFIFLICF